MVSLGAYIAAAILKQGELLAFWRRCEAVRSWRRAEFLQSVVDLIQAPNEVTNQRSFIIGNCRSTREVLDTVLYK